MMHRNTRIQAYQLRSGGVRARMAILRMIAADSAHNANPSTRLEPGDWRGARDYGLGSYAQAFGKLSQGLNDGKPVWFAHDGEQFRDERFCDEVADIRHTGWFGDTEHQENTFRGIVARLTHGRFIAGYHCDMNDERVYFPEVFTEEKDAARMADEHARIIAEQEDDYSRRWNRAQKIDSVITEKAIDIARLFALRNHSTLGQRARAELSEQIHEVRTLESERESLKVE